MECLNRVYGGSRRKMRKLEPIIAVMSDKTYNVTKYVLAALLIEVVVLTTANVFGRYVLNHSISWAEEFIRFSFVWATFLGAACGYKLRELIAVSVLVGRFPQGYRRRVGLAIELVISFFLVLSAIYGVKLTHHALHQIAPATQIPMAFAYACMPLACFIMMISNAHHILLYLRSDSTIPTWGENW